jgi:hypothetical protein
MAMREVFVIKNSVEPARRFLHGTEIINQGDPG